MKDVIMKRMKEQYEIRTRTYLPRRSYVIIRIDGKNFGNYTKGLERPFDNGFAEDMNETTKYLCKNIQGAKFGYVQSDEISILITDFDKTTSQSWFDYQVQKMVSVSASMASAKFNNLRLQRMINDIDMDMGDLLFSKIPNMNLASFDARVFSIPDPFEVHNYFVARQNDATKNSISMAAQSMYPHEELKGKNGSEMQEMMFQKGVNWNDYPVRFKRGGFICKEKYTYGALGGEDVPENFKLGPVERTRWVSIDPPIFTKEKDFTYSRIPVIGGDGVITLSDLVGAEEII